MRRIVGIILCVLMLGTLWGCKESQSTEEGNYTKYALVSMGMSGWNMSAKEVQEYSGVKDLYLKLYEDGTAKIRVDKTPKDMVYDENYIWQTENPDLKMSYVIDGNTLTITDGAYTYIFEK